MVKDGKSQRARERIGLQLPVRVRCRETATLEWVEVTRLSDVTPFGAGFVLSRPTEEGRLLQLSMPLPRPLRCYDFTEDQYRIWALVRRVRLASAKAKGSVAATEATPCFEIGVAFTGKHPPASYERDPTTRYEAATGANGLWNPSEQPEHASRYVSPDTPREETRVAMPVDVVVETFDATGKIAAREETVTENISRRGAAIFSALGVERGQFVRVTSRSFGISVIACVRRRRTGADSIPRLHLEFIGKEFPLEGIG